MILYYSVADGKSQPHSHPFGGIFGSEEWVENLIQNLFRHTIPGIDKVHFDPVGSAFRVLTVSVPEPFMASTAFRIIFMNTCSMRLESITTSGTESSYSLVKFIPKNFC